MMSEYVWNDVFSYVISPIGCRICRLPSISWHELRTKSIIICLQELFYGSFSLGSYINRKFDQWIILILFLIHHKLKLSKMQIIMFDNYLQVSIVGENKLILGHPRINEISWQTTKANGDYHSFNQPWKDIRFTLGSCRSQ